MDSKLINPFIDAFTEVMPQLGFTDIKRKKVAVKEKTVKSMGVTVLVGITKQARGNVAYNMSENTAKYIASAMMCGMPVEAFDEMAQSAIAEMSNMITANAATQLSGMDIAVDISTPSVSMGDGFFIKISTEQYLSIEMDLAGNIIELNIVLQ